MIFLGRKLWFFGKVNTEPLSSIGPGENWTRDIESASANFSATPMPRRYQTNLCPSEDTF